MSMELARQVADAIMFEGYVLYPYRASAVKNQARWQFGVLTPPGSDEPTASQTECLVEGLEPGGRLDVVLRFLQVQARGGDQPWDEGVVREVAIEVALEPALDAEVVRGFDIAGGADESGGVLRRRWPLRGSVTVRTQPLAGPYGLVRMSVRVTNESEVPAGATRRPALLRHSLVAAHSLLRVSGGSFVSMLEPPEWAAGAVAGCRNEHTWPVLVGTGGQDVMLSSPIILYDHPEIAPESAGDMCDATEMDEMLVLRTLTLTDAEKAEVRRTDARAAGILDQAEAMPAEMFDRLHGAIRHLRAVSPGGHVPGLDGQSPTPWWDPGVDSSVSPETDRVLVTGGEVASGSKVRLHPRLTGTDAQDMFLRGQIATVEAVVADVDGTTHVAVSLDNDPAAGLTVGRYKYFLPTELELVGGLMMPEPRGASQVAEQT